MNGTLAARRRNNMDATSAVMLVGIVIIGLVGLLAFRIHHEIKESEYNIRMDIIKFANLIVDHTKPIVRGEEDVDCNRQTRH